MSKNQTLETSSNSTPKIKSALLDKYDNEYKKEVDGYERLKTKESEKLPKPTGWRIELSCIAVPVAGFLPCQNHVTPFTQLSSPMLDSRR